eukprot:642683-Pelagomonas_calceolata.AAC.1
MHICTPWWPPQPIAPGSGTATGEGPAKYGGGIPGTTIPPGIACIGGCSIVAPPGIAPGICGTSRVLPATAPVTPPVKGGSSCTHVRALGGVKSTFLQACMHARLHGRLCACTCVHEAAVGCHGAEHRVGLRLGRLGASWWVEVGK